MGCWPSSFLHFAFYAMRLSDWACQDPKLNNERLVPFTPMTQTKLRFAGIGTQTYLLILKSRTHR